MQKYLSIPHGDNGQGIDALSSEDSLAEGYAEDIVNFDPTPEGYLSKRPGWQGKWGFLPVRVKEVIYATGSTNNLTFILDSSIDLTAIPSSLHSRPIVAFGRTSSQNPNSLGNQGTFPVGSDASAYYPTLNADPRHVFLTGTHTLVIPVAQSGITSVDGWVGVAQSLSETSLDYLDIVPDSISANSSTLEIDIGYTNNTGAPFNTFVYGLQLPPTTGINYVSPPTTFATGTHSTTITAATHGLDNSNIQLKAFVVSGSTLTEFRPDSVVIDTADNITVGLTNRTGSSISVVFVISAAPIANVLQGSAGPDSTLTIPLVSPTYPFAFINCYVEQSVGGPREEVWPDSIQYDAASNIINITFRNNQAASANFFIYYQYARIGSNRITVTGSPVLTAFTDTSPQLTLWGLDHSLIYGPQAGAEAGWVTHLDTYRSIGDQFLVSGLGGNLFSGSDTDAATDAAYLIPTLYPNLQARTNGTAVCGPTFLNTLSGPFRTAGHIRGDNIAPLTGCQSMKWNPITGYTDVVMAIQNVQVIGTLSAVINTTAGFEDQLTIQAAGWAVQNGTYPIKAVSLSATSGNALLTLSVANPNVTSTDWDDSSSGAQVGIFTDRLTLIGTSEYIPGDILLSEVLVENQQIACVASNGTMVLFGGFNAQTTFPGGVRIAGQRVSNVMPLRQLDGTESVTDLVVGDNIRLTGFAREFRVVDINTAGSDTVTIVGNGALATATLGTQSTASMAVGDSLLLIQAGAFTGAQVVTSIPSTTSFQFASAVTATQAGLLQGKTATLDETFLWSDNVNSSITAAVPGRWLPIEAPSTSQNETPGPYTSYLSTSSYTTQPILRSTMVSDSLMLNNGVDRTLKVDGANLYRPGLPRWQAQLFAAVAPGATGLIALPGVECNTLAANSTIHTPPWTQFGAPSFYVDASVVDTFQAGARIVVSSGTGTVYIVQSASTETNTSGVSYGVITVDQTIQEAAPTGSAFGTLQQVSTYSYYFRLNAVDANNNVTASAATGSFDFTFPLSVDAAIQLRLIGMPALDIYDYDRLEVQIYRTKLNGVAPYYLISTLPMSFNAHDGYIDFTDSTPDDTLTDLDPVNTALKGQELGVGWSAPIRAKRITSANGRLVLGNLTSDPYIDIRLYPTLSSTTTTSQLAGKLFRFYKDEGSTASTTPDMVSLMTTEFLTSGDLAAAVSSTTSTTFTVTATHGLTPATSGQWVYLFRKAAAASNQQTHFMGWWQVASIPDSTHLVLNWASVSKYTPYTFANEIDRLCIAASSPFALPVWLGTDHNYANLAATLGSDGILDCLGMSAIRMSNAINAAQRMVDRSLTAYAAFSPWLVADGGGEFAAGEVILRQSMNQTSTPAVQLPTLTGASIYVNNVLRTGGSLVGAVSQLFGSRLLVSYANFPEVFDSPLAQVDSQSDSAIDVNPSDGQQITALIPFYGDSSFGAAMKDAIILVFKTNSIYLINVAQKAAGANPIQRIESMGLGCTAPNSVTPTRTGIMFANESGIYKLQQDMTMYYMGRHLQRKWREGVNLDALDLVFGHNYAFNSQYKVSVPLLGSSTPNGLFAYNSTREYSTQGITSTIQLYSTREGSWAEQDGFSSIGFAALGADSYYASMKGRVFILRRTNLPQDYRDDASAIAATATLRAMDFGDAGIRKSVPFALVSYRNPTALGDRAGVQVLSATDLSEDFQASDAAVLQDNAERVGTGDYEGSKVLTYRYAFHQKRGVRFQLQIQDSTIDQPVEITKIVYSVAGLTIKGTRDAAAGAAPAQNAAN